MSGLIFSETFSQHLKVSFAVVVLSALRDYSFTTLDP